jgi:N-acetylneuraminic acid mutarotase
VRTLATLGLVLCACGTPPISGPNGAAPPVEVPDPCDSVGAWHRVAPLELSGRVDHTAVWTGREMVVWGGTRGTSDPRGDGARYQPEADLWQTTTTSEAPLERDDHAAVWTGTEMIVWGGNHDDERTEKLDSGGRYDPGRDVWRPTSPSGLTARDDPRAVWTGTEMIVWGGRDQQGHTATGARYTPATDRWIPVSTDGAPDPREDHTAIWTGTEMIVWGGWNGKDGARNYALPGGRYDPASDTWRPISDVGAPDPREDHTAIWTGTEMIVWGGVVREGKPAARRQLATGGRYSPATDTWTPITLDDAPTAREDGVVVWTGTQMLVWGGQQDEIPTRTGARYVPEGDRWCELVSDGSPSARRDHAGVWTGSSLVVWGGRGPDGDYPTDGASYVP